MDSQTAMAVQSVLESQSVREIPQGYCSCLIIFISIMQCCSYSFVDKEEYIFVQTVPNKNNIVFFQF